MKPEVNRMNVWLEKINSETILLFHHLNLFKKLNDIISGNEKLKRMDSTLIGWMRKAFTDDLIIGLGRICDTDKRTESLIRFLKELKNHPECLTRSAYIQLYKSDNAFMLEIANRDFDNLAGQGAEAFSIEKIDTDLKRLVEEDPCKKIRSFRDQYVAHSDAIKDGAPPTYDDLFATFEIIEEVVKKYNILLRAANMSHVTPTIQGNWEEALTIPWIDKTS